MNELERVNLRTTFNSMNDADFEIFYDVIREKDQLENQLQQKENIIKEVRDILKRYICNPSGLKDGWHIDCWNNEDIFKLNEDLGILDKESK